METLAYHAVYHDEGLIGGVQGCPLTDADGTGGTGRSGALRDLQAGNLSEQQILGGVGFHAVDFTGLDGHDRTREVALAHLTVTDHHHFVQILRVGLQHDEVRERAGPEGNRSVADAADFNRGAGAGNGQGEFALRPGGNAVLGARFDNRGADDRPLRVYHGSFHPVPALGGYGNGHHA